MWRANEQEMHGPQVKNTYRWLIKYALDLSAFDQNYLLCLCQYSLQTMIDMQFASADMLQSFAPNQNKSANTTTRNLSALKV